MMIATCTTANSAELESGVKMIQELHNLREECKNLREQAHCEEVFRKATVNARMDDALTIEELHGTIEALREIIVEQQYKIEDQRMQIHELLCAAQGMMFH